MLMCTLLLMLGRNTLISIETLTPSIGISINPRIKNQMGSGQMQKHQR